MRIHMDPYMDASMGLWRFLQEKMAIDDSKGESCAISHSGSTGTKSGNST